MHIEGYYLPDELYYEKNHYWIRIDGDRLEMGMDDFAEKMAGDIVFVQLPFEGKKLVTGKKFANVESGKWLGKIYAPVNGKIIESNEALETDPGLINKDCYGEGWMFRIDPNDMDEVKQLIHSPEAVEKWLLADIEKYKKT